MGPLKSDGHCKFKSIRTRRLQLCSHKLRCNFHGLHRQTYIQTSTHDNSQLAISSIKHGRAGSWEKVVAIECMYVCIFMYVCDFLGRHGQTYIEFRVFVMVSRFPKIPLYLCMYVCMYVCPYRPRKSSLPKSTVCMYVWMDVYKYYIIVFGCR